MAWAFSRDDRSGYRLTYVLDKWTLIPALMFAERRPEGTDLCHWRRRAWRL